MTTLLLASHSAAPILTTVEQEMAIHALLRGNVDRGARLLDREVPGWVALIDLGRLDMRLTTQCVLGQLYDGPSMREVRSNGHAPGGYNTGLAALGLNLQTAVTHGFAVGDCHLDLDYEASLWLFLQSLWVMAILARRAAGEQEVLAA